MIGKYRLIEERPIGFGNQGIVYKAINPAKGEVSLICLIMLKKEIYALKELKVMEREDDSEAILE
jgi:hypothetical protein